MGLAKKGERCGKNQRPGIGRKKTQEHKKVKILI